MSETVVASSILGELALAPASVLVALEVVFLAVELGLGVESPINREQLELNLGIVRLWRLDMRKERGDGG